MNNRVALGDILADVLGSNLRLVEDLAKLEKACDAESKGFDGSCFVSSVCAAEVTQFLTHLAAERGVAASTQSQALSALLFLYSTVLGKR